ncbi:hypothetical protein BHF71_06740 [Vulcanibacillus modesticaldus]|uniref:Uncharacterized protein n=1 Tax=Vulcanibacillus modesticaldus TaxID=337097 RepID=A0A1D2YWQ4_9BACI|nr:hypothetical protein [Vulcanibacillus modesticaldus]OEG00053.1 hypothetical protein BHF71_06740 [Vulcanibacillus modesticaldus]
MHYYTIKPLFTPDGHSIDMSLGDEAVTIISHAAYNAIENEVNVYDMFIRGDHQDVLVFNDLNAFKKAAEILKNHQIQFTTNIVEKTAGENADYITNNYRYKVVIPNEPNIDSIDDNDIYT